MIIRTGISTVLKSNGDVLKENGIPVALFDRLFDDGGLEVPDSIINDWIQGTADPMRLLFSGAAGTGKTTLALELAYRLAKNGIPHPTDSEQKLHFLILYISSESPGSLIISNKVDGCGWEKSLFINQPDLSPADLAPDQGKIIVFGTDANKLGNIRTAKAFFGAINQGWGQLLATKDVGKKFPAPGVIVIDSLNVLPDDESKAQEFVQLTSKFGKNQGPFLIVLVLDSEPSQQRHRVWEYAADIVIDAGRENVDDSRVDKYLINWLQIIKARWQKHAFGRHQLKLFGKMKSGDAHFPPRFVDSLWTTVSAKKAKGTIAKTIESDVSVPPYRLEGGIQVYESVHRHLSDGTRRRPADVGSVPTPFPKLDDLVGGGFPKHRSTALVGVRGGMKSHLAYLWLLIRASGAEGKSGRRIRTDSNSEQSKCLLITLRDDLAEARDRLRRIYEAETRSFKGLQDPEELERSGRLRIVHFRPGYIVPDEFLFRLWFHINDLKPENAVVNGLEQFDVLFPLCSIEPVFVPSIVDTFTESAGITSLFIGATGEGEPVYQNALLPTSALVLKFEREEKTRKTILDVVRVPSASPGGGRGELRLDNGKLGFFPR